MLTSTTAGYNIGKHNRSRLLCREEGKEEGYRTAKIMAMSPNKQAEQQEEQDE